ncbi:MAG: hypothetical protein DMG24_18980 [Acidobacteria bacterium]|nr:MAG: hypothetical protein DMG24_18980 [Acidobacteriota bacterium]
MSDWGKQRRISRRRRAGTVTDLGVLMAATAYEQPAGEIGGTQRQLPVLRINQDVRELAFFSMARPGRVRVR